MSQRERWNLHSVRFDTELLLRHQAHDCRPVDENDRNRPTLNGRADRALGEGGFREENPLLVSTLARAAKFINLGALDVAVGPALALEYDVQVGETCLELAMAVDLAVARD